jgi:hypothetical protein
MSSELLQGILEASDGAGHVNRLAQSVISQVRSAVRSGKKVPQSATADAIPEELWSDACALLLEKLQGRLPALRLSADQVRAADVARQKLRSVARGEVALTMPSDPAPGHMIAPVRCLGFRRKRVKSSSLGGL